MLDGRGPSTLLIRPVASYVRADAEDPDSVRDGLRRSSIDGVARIGSAVLTYADEGDEVAIALRTRGAEELGNLFRALDPQAECRAMVYGSLFHNVVYHACVERFADRPLPRVDDILEAVAASLDSGFEKR
jgi:N-acetylglucosamine kinase-like BadF-type ATPase